MKFYLKHLDSLVSDENFSMKNNPEPCAVFNVKMDKWMVSDGVEDIWPLSERSGEEKMDVMMKRMPVDETICYVSYYNMNEEGTLPEDLTATEKILTGLLWGEISQTKAILLVAAIENMDASLIKKQLDELGLF